MTKVKKVRVADLMRVLSQMLTNRHYFVDVEIIDTLERPNTILIYPHLSAKKIEPEEPLDDAALIQAI